MARADTCKYGYVPNASPGGVRARPLTLVESGAAAWCPSREGRIVFEMVSLSEQMHSTGKQNFDDLDAEGRIGLVLRRGIRWTVVGFASLWAAGAVYVDGPLGMDDGNIWLAVAWLAVAAACLALIRIAWKKYLVWLVWFLVVLIPWTAKNPSNERPWKPEWAKTGWVEFSDGALEFHNFRNFDYGADGSVVESWETRTVSIRNLRGMDYFHDAFGGDLIAHPMLSFDFGADGYVALSVETRREVDEAYSKLGGLYKMFELQYLWGDERDFVRVRTNVRDEPVYLYRTSFPREQALFVLLDSVRETNLLARQPRFYNVISANCTTSLLAQTVEFRNAPFDIRMLANGRFDELIYETGGILGDGLPFEELRERALINPVALYAHGDAAFSQRIRADRVGFD
jgi:hypothetical protein